jgi:diguanylate cyclase (GGDEF)-like protein
MLSITKGADLYTTFMMGIFLVGYSAGIAGRNNQRPWISSFQMWLSIAPILYHFVRPDTSAAISIVGIVGTYVSLRRDVSRPLYRTHLDAYRTLEEKGVVESQFDLALKNMGNGIALYDKDARLVFSNERMSEILGIADNPLAPGVAAVETFRAFHDLGIVSKAACDSLCARLEAGLAKELSGFDLPLLDGRTVEFAFGPINGGGTVVVVEDISERKQNAAHIERLARFAPLPDLPNRVNFKERLDDMLLRKERFAVLAVDLDKFKSVNDTLGHTVGDKLLRAVSLRMQGMAGSQDVVSRFGGDEFMILRGFLPSTDDAALFARRIVQTLSAPYEIDSHSLVIGASVGIAIAPADARDAETLLQYADMALYRAKAEGRGNYMFFDASMDAEAQKKRLMEVDLRHAMVRDELQVHFQPQFNLAAGRFLTCEALIRWISPARGFVSPAEFIPVAEETGLIVEIGEWVLRQSCLAALSWPSDMRVAVNLSAVQFRSGNLVQTVNKVLRETRFPAARLELEITESLIMGDSDRNGEIMRELQAMGVRISLDDFGQGYSGLKYIQDYNFQKLKLDMTLVRDMRTSAKAEAIVKAVTNLSHEIGMSITFEGIETADMVADVVKFGGTDIQGWFYSKALPQKALLEFLSQQAGAAAKPLTLAA